MQLVATRDGFGKALLKCGKENKNIVSVEADLGKSTRSNLFAKEFPERNFNVGIAEQNMMLVAAGLASCGKIPFASTFAIFSERGFEQIRTSIARRNANVKIVGSHAGLLTGEDGSSAQATEDIAIYRSLPNMAVVSPADAVEAEKATIALIQYKGPAYLRLTREKVPVIFDDNHKFELGKGQLLRGGKDAAVIATGPLVAEALEAHEILKKEGISLRVINMPTIKPIDDKLIVKAAKETKGIITAEDHNIIGGLGSAVAEVLAEKSPSRMVRIGMNDVFGESGKPYELYEKYGLTSKHIAKEARQLLRKT